MKTGNPAAVCPAGFPHVYQMSTKKASDPLRRRGSEAFHILGRLPDVYHSHLLTSKSHILVASSRLFQPFCPASGV